MSGSPAASRSPRPTLAARLESARYVYLRRVVGSLLGAIGLDASLRLARALARGYGDLNPPGKAIAANRLRAAFGPRLSDAECDAIVRTMYDHLARFWIEALYIPRRLCVRSWRRCVALADAGRATALAARHPRALFATCYFGNPGVAAFALARLWGRARVMVDFLDDPAARAWQERLYRLPGVRPLDGEALEAERHSLFERPGALLLVAEHRRQRGGGVTARFLDSDGPFQTTPGKLAEWYDLPVIPTLCRRRGGSFDFELWLGEPVRGADAAETTRALLAQLDREVRRWPEQYVWNVSPKR